MFGRRRRGYVMRALRGRVWVASCYQEDGDAGLRLLGHRYYDSTTGRFITRDPAEVGDNWYAYCDNNATGGVDPAGLFGPWSLGCGILGLGVVIAFDILCPEAIVAELIAVGVSSALGATGAALDGASASDVLLGGVVGAIPGPARVGVMLALLTDTPSNRASWDNGPIGLRSLKGPVVRMKFRRSRVPHVVTIEDPNLARAGSVPGVERGGAAGYVDMYAVDESDALTDGLTRMFEMLGQLQAESSRQSPAWADLPFGPSLNFPGIHREL